MSFPARKTLRAIPRIVAAVAIIFFLVAPLCYAAPSTTLDRPAYLIDQQRYEDAADYLAAANDPKSVQNLFARATLLLYCGRPHAASVVFEKLRTLLPKSDPLPDYAEGICALMQKDYPAAARLLNHAEASQGYSDHKAAIDLAQAAADICLGDSASAQRLIGGSDLPAAREMAALNALRSSAGPDSIETTRELLESWELPGGVPRVIEAPGLRCEAGTGDPIPQAIENEMVAESVASRLTGTFTPAAMSNPVKQVSGTVTLRPSGREIASGSLVTFFVDNDLAAAINGGSYSFHWDTTSVPNGVHTVLITVTEPNNPSAAPSTESAQFDVENNSPAIPSTASALAQTALSGADQVGEADDWYLLALQPSYRAIELALSRAEANAGDRDESIEHLMTAAAIDFEYAGGEKAIAGIYTGRIPIVYNLTGGRGPSAKAVASVSKTMGIWRGNPNIKEVALTFDDGPSPTDCPPLLDALRDNQVPATFFVVGIRAEASPDILRRMHADGDEVEDHTFSHPNLDQAIPVHIYEEILRNAVIVHALTGIWPHFLRPPGGETNPFVLQAAQNCGMAGAFWTIDVLSAEDAGSSEGVVNFVMSRIRPGAVVLMHNGAFATTGAIPELSKQLRARGYKLVTLIQLARDASSEAPVKQANGTAAALRVFSR